MARQLRLEYAGAFYHVMARGNRRLPIFWDEDESPRLAGGTGPSLWTHRLARARLGAAQQSLPPVPGNAGAQLGHRHEVAAEHVYPAL